MKSDMSILEEFGASLAPEGAQPPAEVRHRVINAMRSPTRRRRFLPHLDGVRLAWRIGTPAAAAAAVAAAVLSGHLTDTAGRVPAPPGSGTTAAGAPGAAGPGNAGPGTTAPGATTPGAKTPAAPTGARQVLVLAAQHAAATPAMDARPDQFLFIDSVNVSLTTDGQGRSRVSEPTATRTWLSVDGTRDGLVIEGRDRTHLDGCTNGRQAETIDRPENSPQVACTPQPAYQPGRIPTDARGFLAYVRKIAADQPEWRQVSRGKDGTPNGFVRLSDDQRAFDEIVDILFSNHLPAVQKAALQAAEQIPGVRVGGRVKDAAGRSGVAVTRTEAGFREELIFAPDTYRYLGHNTIGAPFDPADATVLPRPGKGGRIMMISHTPAPGEVIHKFALKRIAIVDEAGRRP